MKKYPEPYKSYCDLIIKKVKGNKYQEDYKEKELNNKKEINESLKEKYKSNNKKFLSKLNINIKEDEKNNETGIQKMKIEIETDYDITTEQCIYCKKNINEKDLFNCFGKIGYFLLDKFIYNSSKRRVNNLYYKYIKNNKRSANIKLWSYYAFFLLLCELYEIG